MRSKHFHHMIWSMDEDGVAIHCAHCGYVAYEFESRDEVGDRMRVWHSQRAHKHWHETRVSDPSGSL